MAETREDIDLGLLFASGTPVEEGLIAPIPSMPLPEAAPRKEEASTAQMVEEGRVEQRQTGEEPDVPAVLEKLSIGDEVTLPDGTKTRVQWMDPRRRRVGVGKRKGRNYTFYSFEEFTELTGSELQTAVEEPRRRDAREQGEEPPRRKKLPVKISVPSGRKLYPHQIESVEFLMEKGRGIVASEMGLGKTATAIVAMETPAVVVCPSLLKVNWSRELAMWQPEASVAVINGRSTDAIEQEQREADVVVMNYELIQSHFDWVMKRENRTLIADEAHYLKTMRIEWKKDRRDWVVESGSQRAIAFYKMARQIERLFLLTGTPILNRVRELFPLLHMVEPRTWGSFFRFCQRYCSGHYEWVMARGGGTKKVFDCDGRSNSDELHGTVKGTYMMRHTKEEELANFPEKRRETITVSMPTQWQTEYRSAALRFAEWVQENGGPEAVARMQRAEQLVKIGQLRAVAAQGKVEAALQWITRHCESTGFRPLVVFALHLEVFRMLEDGIKKINSLVRRKQKNNQLPPIARPIRYAKIVGGMSQTARQSAIDAFQLEGEVDVLFYSIPIATGTTLTRSQDALFLERMWRPADMVQAEDRLHRIGQENHVSITIMDAEGTIDGKMALLLREKSEAFSAVIDGIELDTNEANALVFGEMFRELGVGLTDEQQRAISRALREEEVVENPGGGDDMFADPYVVAAAGGAAYEDVLAANPTSADEMRMGILEEFEHTADPATAAAIACDHLREMPDYYSMLSESKQRWRGRSMRPNPAGEELAVFDEEGEFIDDFGEENGSHELSPNPGVDELATDSWFDPI